MATPSSFSELQAGFYNAFLTGMGLNPGDPVQLLQPSDPLSSGANADALLWQYFNFLPPDSLTGSFILSGGNQFLSNYQAVLSALQAQPNAFQTTVGADCFNAWIAALRGGTIILGSDVATTFQVFAMTNPAWSAVAASGAAAIRTAFLDPIFAAQQNCLPYKPAGTKDVNFVPGFSDLAALLSKAPGRSFSVAQDAWNTDTSQSWSTEISSQPTGLWGGGNSSSALSQKFSAGGVAVEARFAHLEQFTAQPGNWYSAKAFGLAFNARNRSPWIAGKPVDWDTTFGPDGTMQRFTSTLIVVDTMDVTVTSLQVFSSSEQAAINANSPSGLWPFYTQGSAVGAQTDVAFASDGAMTIKITSQPGAPIVVAAWVLPASQYLGQAR
jgi:hypothetical protein